MPLLATEKIDEDGLIATYTAADVGGDTIVNSASHPRVVSVS